MGGAQTKAAGEVAQKLSDDIMLTEMGRRMKHTGGSRKRRTKKRTRKKTTKKRNKQRKTNHRKINRKKIGGGLPGPDCECSQYKIGSRGNAVCPAANRRGKTSCDESSACKWESYGGNDGLCNEK
jgi:hypothetical protein